MQRHYHYNKFPHRFSNLPQNIKLSQSWINALNVRHFLEYNVCTKNFLQLKVLLKIPVLRISVIHLPVVGWPGVLLLLHRGGDGPHCPPCLGPLHHHHHQQPPPAVAQVAAVAEVASVGT